MKSGGSAERSEYVPPTGPRASRRHEEPREEYPEVSFLCSTVLELRTHNLCARFSHLLQDLSLKQNDKWIRSWKSSNGEWPILSGDLRAL